jgi:DNA-binding transcriptional ArsR family regulator
LIGNVRILYAQAYDPPQRIEIEVDQDTYPYHLRLLKENGLVLIARTDPREVGKWTIIHYDTNLVQLLKKDVRMETPLVLSAANSDRENFYAILQTPSSVKANIINTYILVYNVLSKKIDVFSFYLADKVPVNNIVLFGDVFVFTTTNAKFEENIYSFNTKSLVTDRFYEHKTAPSEFQQAYTDTVTNSLWLVTKFYESKKQTIFTLTQLNEQGKKIFEKDIVMDENYYLNSCRIIRTDTNRFLLTGEYALHTKENIFTTRNNNSGIFTVEMINNEIQQVSYLIYEQLEGPFGSVDRKKPSDLYSNMYIAAQNDSIVIVIGDFYTPEYVHEVSPDRTMGYNSWFGSPYLSTETKLAGFKYHLAYFFIYNKSGRLLWYNTFNYNGLMLRNIKELMHTYIDPETHNTLYYFGFDGKLYSLINNKNEIIQPIAIENIDPSSRFLSVNANILFQCEHWYDDYFVYYGYQRLHNRYISNAKSKKNNHSVFYVNKLVYR